MMRRDDAWFERFYERHRVAISAYCTRRVGVDDAADATAQVFVVAWKRCDDIPDGDRALPWLYGVARRVVSRQWRSAGRARRLSMKARGQRVAAAPGPDSITVERAEHAVVRQAVMELRDNDREVLLLSAWEGLTNGEIADVIGCSHAAADKRIARAKVRLAERYERLTAAGRARADASLETRSPVRARKGGGDA